MSKQINKGHRRVYGRYKLYKWMPADCMAAKEYGHQSAMWGIIRKTKHEEYDTAILLYKKEDGWRFELNFDIRLSGAYMRNYDMRVCDIAIPRLEKQRFSDMHQAMQAFCMAMQLADDQRREEVQQRLAQEKAARENKRKHGQANQKANIKDA